MVSLSGRVAALAVHTRLPWMLAGLVVLLVLPSLNAGFLLDDQWQQYILSGKTPVEKPLAPHGLFVFVDGEPSKVREMVDAGTLPWWTLDTLRISFWRPLSELTHGLDHALAPNLPALAHAHKGQREMIAAMIRTAFAQPDHEAAVLQWRQVADNLRPKVDKLAALMDQAEADGLAFMTFPKELRSKLHSTNPLERVNKEIKRRTDVVGIFPNEPAIERLVGAVLLENNDEWLTTRRYMPLEAMAKSCNLTPSSQRHSLSPTLEPQQTTARGGLVHHARGRDPSMS